MIPGSLAIESQSKTFPVVALLQVLPFLRRLSFKHVSRNDYILYFPLYTFPLFSHPLRIQSKQVVFTSSSYSWQHNPFTPFCYLLICSYFKIYLASRSSNTSPSLFCLSNHSPDFCLHYVKRVVWRTAEQKYGRTFGSGKVRLVRIHAPRPMPPVIEYASPVMWTKEFLSSYMYIQLHRYLGYISKEESRYQERGKDKKVKTFEG